MTRHPNAVVRPAGRIPVAIALVAVMAFALLAPLLFAGPTQVSVPSGFHGPSHSESGAAPSAEPVTTPRIPALPLHPSGVRSGFSGHYYAGSVYVGSNASATSLGVDIGVPQDTPQATDFYYVLLSVWDNAKSYDQIGLVNNNGSWEVSYSYTSACAGSYTFSTSAFGLDADTTYLFEMQLVSNNLQFSVSLPSGGTLWSDSAGSAATSFVLANTFYCNGGAYYDYSNYEEVYGTSAPVPPYSFFFTNNTEDFTAESNWITYVTSGAPSGVNVVTGGTETVIENEPFGVSAAPKLIAEVGSFARNYSETVSVAKYGADTLLTPSISGSIPRARVSILPSNGSAPVTFNLTVMVNASSQPGSGYGLEIEVTDTHGVYARIEVVVQLNAQLAATTPGARPTSTDVNRTVVLTESPSGGSGTYGYLWSGLPAGCP
ncbi:MAG TPA: hypothetical protein VGS23_00310, partial [Thermoplasmata archaeon]|nr:hypothetical protein [Thermoplasmata archaeon]